MHLRASIIAISIAVCAGAKSGPFEVTVPPQMRNATNSATCNPCIQLGSQGLNILLNYILNAGVVGGCGKLCSSLPKKDERLACDVVCGAVGIKAFMKALNNTDLDPFYFCEVVHACTAGPDDANVQLVSVELDPATISKADLEPSSGGVQLQGTLTINVTKGSGVGEFAVGIHGPVTEDVGSTFLLAKGLPEGVQQLGVKVTVQDTMPDPSDPSKLPVTWSPGSYEFRFHVCQGECGSKHPHSIDFGHKSSNFTITESRTVSI